ncbi:MAG: DUF512 domain-containing protein [Syntrophomonadaceae bacterium]|nr:DUF512 domain-containing protein [Syntrophomonadaceae bacterium]
MPAKIIGILNNSIAEEVGMEIDDLLLSINGNVINDIIDYQYYSQDDWVVVEIKKTNQEVWEIEIEKDYDEDLGLMLDGVIFDKMKVCKNRCLFCFVDQLPKDMRDTLYVKDDDYRYSFLYGNFITLTNLKEQDWDKIISMRLSPLYVSVHSMDPEIRAQMMKNPHAKSIREDLTRLKEAGIEVHTQIVLCPGVNDGQVLIDTINELANYYPSVISVGIVPVGLTGHREGLNELRPFSKEEALEIIELTNTMQKRFREEFDLGFVYIADEFFIKAGVNFPDANYYDEYVQIENGIGLARILIDDFESLRDDLPAYVDEEREVFLVTGMSAVTILQPIVDTLNNIEGLKVELIPVVNNYFGGNVTVTGLLTGTDIINTLGKKYAGKIVIIPEIVFKEGQLVLLDDISLEDIKRETGAVIKTVDGTAESLIDTIINN